MRWWAEACVLLGITACGFSQGDGGDTIDASGTAGDGSTADAGDGDGPPVTFDGNPPPNCPMKYNIERGGSKYYISSAQADWLSAEMACESDTSNLTHLWVPNDDPEWTYIRDHPQLYVA